MILEEIEAEKIMNIIVRRVLRLGDFLQNHRSFALDLLALEARVKKYVAQ